MYSSATCDAAKVVRVCVRETSVFEIKLSLRPIGAGVKEADCLHMVIMLRYE